jgi:hypothetical protein
MFGLYFRISVWKGEETKRVMSMFRAVRQTTIYEYIPTTA